MTKPTIAIVAHSLTVLAVYAEALSKSYELVWIVYHRTLEKELRQLGYTNVHFIDLELGLEARTLFNRFVHKALRVVGLFGKLRQWAMERVVSGIEQKFAPALWISDTGWPLSDIQVKTKKIEVFHSVCLKRFSLEEGFQKFDILFLPNEWISERMKKLYPASKAEHQIVGWPRAEALARKFKKSNLASERSRFLSEKMGLDAAKKTILFAPSWGTYSAGRLFPASFGDEEKVIDQLIELKRKLNFNFIIKVHHYMYKQIHDQKLQERLSNAGIQFFPKQNTGHPTFDNNDFLLHADVMISDVSGVITDYLVLDRPIVFLEPDAPDFSWKTADYLPEMRCGDVVHNGTQLEAALQKALLTPEADSARRIELRSLLFRDFDFQKSLDRAQDVIRSLVKNP